MALQEATFPNAPNAPNADAMKLPATSQCHVRLKITDYDLSQLPRALDTAIAGIILDPSPIPDNYCHVHTLTVPALLAAPDTHFEYPTGLRENPDRKVYDEVVDALKGATEAGMPVTLSLPTEACVHLPFDFLKLTKDKRARVIQRSPDVFLPSSRRERPLVKLPAVHEYAGRVHFANSTTWDQFHWLHAALALDPDELPTRKGVYRDDKSRVALRTGVQLVWFPDANDENAVELRLIITLDAYINMDTLWDPLPDIGVGLLSIFLVTALPTGIENGSGDTVEGWLAARASALKGFYDCLHPAPDHPFSFDVRKLQPPQLSCKLLPFQTRTVRLLLEREGAPLGGDVERHEPGGQWTRLNFGTFGDYWFCRLRAELRRIPTDPKGKGRERSPGADPVDLPNMFNLSKVRGTMLCEEMGLGKTVEAIALMVLHRHPLSIPRPLSIPLAARKSAEIDLRVPPEDYSNPQLREWLDKEHTSFADAVSWSEEAELSVSEVAATLVVTPLPLLQQWVNEMINHAPNLRICVYPGWKTMIKQLEGKRSDARRLHKQREANNLKRKTKRMRNQTRAKYAKGRNGERVEVDMESSDESDDEDDIDDGDQLSLLKLTQQAFLEYVRGHDVVITTYQTLGEDLTVAVPAPARSRRSTAKYNLEERPRSPLVMCEWWRVIMDEVQLHGDQSAASNMVSLIPRKLSLAMSGTPARSDIKDLMGSLRFLRVPVTDRTIWHRLMQPVNAAAFRGLFQAISVRTTKAEVAGEFNLPGQQRFVIPIQLSDIEMHYYLDTLERQRERLRSQQGGFTPQLFRVSLRHLRQICTHIQVGALQRGGLGNVLDRGGRMHLGSHLMTMEEALKKMNDDHQAELVAETRLLMRYTIKKGQFFLLNDADDMRQLRAIGQYQDVRQMSTGLLESARAQLVEVAGDDREDSVEEDDAAKMTQHERERAKEITSIRSSIRETLLLVHQAWFLEGDAHHQLGEEDKEIEAYQAADTIRKEILKRPLRIAEASITSLSTALERHPAYSSADELRSTETNRSGGILSAGVVDQSNSLLAILNDNGLLVHRWREKLFELLTLPVEAETEDIPPPGQGQDVENPDEEYYAKALQAQGEIEAYLTAYAAAIADRKEMLLEDRTILATHESRITKKRATKNSKDAAEDAQNIDLNQVDDQTLNLMLERQAFRDRRKQEDCERPLKAILVELNNIEHSAQRQEESSIASRAAAYLRTYIKAQTDLVNKLNKELETIRATFNRRAVYFAALQDISDSVASEDTTIFRQAYKNADRALESCNERLQALRVRGRYLQYLSGGAGNEVRDVHEECVICFGTSDDKFAMLLACGHAFCVSCYKEYRKSAYNGRKCATCKAVINEREATRVRIQKPEEKGTGSSGEEGPAEMDYEALDEDIYGHGDEAAAAAERDLRNRNLDKINYMPLASQRDIHVMDTMGEYGSKIDFLVKHLKWYKIMKPTVRHVVFSNWADSLHIVEQALHANKIKYVSFDSNTKRNNVVEKFQADSSITVFLLHAERESAGLTLTSCGAVHLLEPVLQHSFELQAIGRVDRLGQESETKVYCYATLDTVESRILAQGVRNGTSIYLANKEEDEAAMAAMENVAHAASHGGDVAAVARAIDEDLLKLIF